MKTFSSHFFIGWQIYLSLWISKVSTYRIQQIIMSTEQ